MKTSSILAAVAALVSLSLPACNPHAAQGQEHGKEGHGKEGHGQEGHGQGHEPDHKIVVTTPIVKDIVFTQPYVCQIRSRRMIEVRPLQEGYLEEIKVNEGQAVKAGDVLFRVVPRLYKATLDAETAKAEVMKIKYENALRLHQRNVVSDQDVRLAKADYDETTAKVEKAQAELDFTFVRAPFDGIIDRLEKQQGSLVKKEDLLTTLSDNSTVWVYFNVPEARYFEYAGTQRESTEADQKTRQKLTQLKLADARIELMLANGKPFKHTADDYVTVLGKFNNETGNIAFRADFPNNEGLLRHGQTGTVLIKRTMKDVLVIPQRATFEVLDKLYVFVVGADHVVHRRQIEVEYEQDDIFVVKKGLDPHDQIIFEGVKQVNDDKHIEFEFATPEAVLKSLKNRAE